MNMNNNPTIEQLTALIANCDDNAGGHILWVSKSGEVQITLLHNETAASWSKRMDDQVQFRFETYHQSRGYVGAQAANDSTYITSLFKDLTAHWEHGSRGYIDSPL